MTQNNHATHKNGLSRLFWKAAFLTAGCVCATTAPAVADYHSVGVYWDVSGYTPSKVTGFRLFREGIPVYTLDSHNSADPENARELHTTVDLVVGVTEFTIAATFNDGSGSAHTARFTFQPASPQHPAPSILNITSSNRFIRYPLLTPTFDNPSEEVTGFAATRRSLNKIYGVGPLPQAIAVLTRPETEQQLANLTVKAGL